RGREGLLLLFAHLRSGLCSAPGEVRGIGSRPRSGLKSQSPFAERGSRAGERGPAKRKDAQMSARKLITTFATLLLLAGAGVAGAFAGGSASSSANTVATLATLALWSTRIALDAPGISLRAARRHPRRMTRRARHFRLDALRARNAIEAIRPSSDRGRRAKRLALAAFYDYSIVGRQWTLSGLARVRGLRA